MITPHEIWTELNRVVVGQDAAVREISVALVKHLVGHPSGNVLLIGNSGSGKTTIMRAVETFLSEREDLARFANVIRLNANVLAEEREASGRVILERLYRNALVMGPEPPRTIDEVARRIERGIVFIDEVDKIRGSVGGEANVKGIAAQEALLTVMESEHLEIEIAEPFHATIAFNSSSLLFVAGGAFEELYDAVLRRATLGTDVVPLKAVVVVSQSGDVREELSFHLRDYLRYEDLFRYGMTPQFLSRFESIVVLDDLGETELAKIFVEPERSIFRVSREYFRRFDIDLQITKSAVKAIAWEASRHRRLGARALREIFRRVIRDREFDPRGDRTEAGMMVVVVDDEMVRKAVRSATQETVRH